MSDDRLLRIPYGFSAMDPERHRAIASLGGKAAHAKGTGRKWDSKSAAEAGRLGGIARARKLRERQTEK